MAVNASKGIVEQFFDEVLNQDNQAAASRLIHKDFVIHHPMLPKGKGGVKEAGELIARFRKAFPDLKYKVDDLLAEDNKVAARWTARGTHKDVLDDIKPTNRKVCVAGTDIFVIADNRIHETWVCSDFAGLMRQLTGPAPQNPV